MTAAQNTISFGAPNRLATYAAAVAAGLLVAVLGVAISARPAVAPASLAGPAQATTVVPSTIASRDQASAYIDSLIAKAADPATIASSEQASAYIDSLIAKGDAVKAAEAAVDLSQVKGINLNDAATIVPPVTASDEANAYMQFLLQRHADAFGQLKAQGSSTRGNGSVIPGFVGPGHN
jgi:hypothetical protein